MIAHPKCATCKHFNPKNSDWDNPLNFGICECVAESWQMSQWNDDCSENELRPIFKDHLASVSDGSAYSARLNVHPDFYCAMHSEAAPYLTPYSEINHA